MKKVALLIAFFIPIMLSGQTFEVLSSTSLRTKAASDSKVITRVKMGDTGTVISTGQWWTNVLVDGREGYIKTAKLRILSVKKVVEQPPPVVIKDLPKPSPTTIHEAPNNTITQVNPPKIETTVQKQLTECEEAQGKMRKEIDQLSEELAGNKVKLAAHKSQSSSFERELASRQKELEIINDKLVSTEANLQELQNKLTLSEQVEKPAEPTEPADSSPTLFRSILDVRGGISILIENQYEEVANGYNLEIQYSYLSTIGLGFEAGVNAISIPELEDFDPFLNPYIGLTIGKHDRSIGFNISPRVYYFMNPTYKLEENSDNTSTSTEIVPGFMIGGSANLRFRLGDKVALTLYGSYMKGDVELKESGTKNGVDYKNNTKNNLDIIHTGLGFAFKI